MTAIATTATAAHLALAQAVNRAKDLAEIFRRRAEGHPARDELLMIAGHLSTAVDELRAYIPPVFDGITVKNTIPAGAAFAIMECMAIAEDTPAVELPSEFFYLVTAPITRRSVHKLLPELPSVDADFDRKADENRTAIRLVEHELDILDPTTRYAALGVVVQLAMGYVELAATAKNRRAGR